MSYPIGIDLGTTNSVVAVYRRGSAETIPVDGQPAMPSAIAARPDGSILIGKSAKARAMLDPRQAILSSKRFIGDGKTEWVLGNVRLTPVDVAAMLLKQMKAAATAYLGEPVTEAVITVPAYFTSNQKRDTKLAGERAGLEVLQLLPEPTAAAVSYGLDRQINQLLMVYDLGGGTFDISVLQVRDNDFRVLAVDGDAQLGGDDFDTLLAEHLLTILQKRSAMNLSVLQRLLKGMTDAGTSLEVLQARQLLKEVAERAKIELSESQDASVFIPSILGVEFEEQISRSQFEQLTQRLVSRTLDKVRAVLKMAKCDAEDVNRIILVGGSTRIPLIRETLTREIKEPFIADRVDEVVAHGAAIIAAHLCAPADGDAQSNRNKGAGIKPLVFRNVTPFSLGVRAAAGQDRDVFQPLVGRNAPIPSIMEKEFTTARANQKSVDISVFQGEASHCAKNTFIGGFRLEGIPPGGAGDPKIGVRFAMDASDLLTVTAWCNNVQGQQTLNVNMISVEEEVLEEVPMADIVFLVDTSGSMTAELNGVKSSCTGFAKAVVSAGIDCRLGLIDFILSHPRRHRYNLELFPLTDPRRFERSIAELAINRIGAGGCYVGERRSIPVIQALVNAFPGDRKKIAILISDEVGNDTAATAEIIALLKRSDVVLHILGVRRSCHELIARETGGSFWDINATRGKVSFAQLLEQIAREITSLALR